MAIKLVAELKPFQEIQVKREFAFIVSILAILSLIVELGKTKKLLKNPSM